MHPYLSFYGRRARHANTEDANMTTLPAWLAEDPQYQMIVRDVEGKRAAALAAAEHLLDTAAAAGGIFGDQYEFAAYWLGEAMAARGVRTEAPAAPVRVKRAPTAAHRRLHRIADRRGGWVCRDCGVGLIDVCADDDIVTDTHGRRIVRPGCEKRLPTRDHEIPRQLDGSNRVENLALVCRPCNSRKGAS